MHSSLSSTRVRLSMNCRSLRTDGFVILRHHFDKAILEQWAPKFTVCFQRSASLARSPRFSPYSMLSSPLPARRTAARLATTSRSLLLTPGQTRASMRTPCACRNLGHCNSRVQDVLAIVDRIVGPQVVMCQLATDTPMLGKVSEFFFCSSIRTSIFLPLLQARRSVLCEARQDFY